VGEKEEMLLRSTAAFWCKMWTGDERKTARRLICIAVVSVCFSFSLFE